MVERCDLGFAITALMDERKTPPVPLRAKHRVKHLRTVREWLTGPEEYICDVAFTNPCPAEPAPAPFELEYPAAAEVLRQVANNEHPTVVGIIIDPPHSRFLYRRPRRKYPSSPLMMLALAACVTGGMND